MSEFTRKLFQNSCHLNEAIQLQTLQRIPVSANLYILYTIEGLIMDRHCTGLKHFKKWN